MVVIFFEVAAEFLLDRLFKVKPHDVGFTDSYQHVFNKPYLFDIVRLN